MNHQGSKQKGNVHSQIIATVFKVIQTQANITITFAALSLFMATDTSSQVTMDCILHPLKESSIRSTMGFVSFASRASCIYAIPYRPTCTELHRLYIVMNVD